MADEDEIKMKVAFEAKYDAVLNSFSQLRPAIEKQLKDIPASVELNSTDTAAFNKAANVLRGDLSKMDKLFQQFGKSNLNDGQITALASQFDSIFAKTKGDVLGLQSKLSKMDYAGIGGARVGTDVAKARFVDIEKVLFGEGGKTRSNFDYMQKSLFDSFYKYKRTGYEKNKENLEMGIFGDDGAKGEDFKQDTKTKVGILDVMKKLGKAIMALIAALGAFAYKAIKGNEAIIGESKNSLGFASADPVLSFKSTNDRRIELLRSAERYMGSASPLSTDEILSAAGKLTTHRQKIMTGQGDVDPAMAQNLQYLISYFGGKGDENFGGKYSLAQLLTDSSLSSFDVMTDLMKAVENNLDDISKLQGSEADRIINAIRGIMGDKNFNDLVAHWQSRMSTGVNKNAIDEMYGKSNIGSTFVTPEMKELEDAFASLKRTMEELKISIYNSLGPALTWLLGKIERFANYGESKTNMAHTRQSDTATSFGSLAGSAANYNTPYYQDNVLGNRRKEALGSMIKKSNQGYEEIKITPEEWKASKPDDKKLNEMYFSKDPLDFISALIYSKDYGNGSTQNMEQLVYGSALEAAFELGGSKLFLGDNEWKESELAKNPIVNSVRKDIVKKFQENFTEKGYSVKNKMELRNLIKKLVPKNAKGEPLTPNDKEMYNKAGLDDTSIFDLFLMYQSLQFGKGDFSTEKIFSNWSFLNAFTGDNPYALNTKEELLNPKEYLKFLTKGDPFFVAAMLNKMINMDKTSMQDMTGGAVQGASVEAVKEGDGFIIKTTVIPTNPNQPGPKITADLN